MVKRSIRISSLMVALLLLPSAAMAAGLGRMSVLSALGQPLRAEIELLSIQADDLGTVEAKLAGADAFRQARIERSAALADLRLSVDKRANGQPVVRIFSATPVNDPFVDLLIELNWSSGRILREYTVLLDPVRDTRPLAEEYMPAPVLATVTEPAPRAQAPAMAPTAKPESSRPEATKPAPDQPARPRTYGPVRSGETLRGIAAKILPPDVTLEMMMASLYQANTKAFAQGNANQLKKGQVLNVPERDAVMLMFSPHQARKLLNEHAVAWHQMRNRMADQAARTVAEPVKEARGRGKIVQAQPEAKPAASAAARDVLKLSKGEPAKTVDAKSSQRMQALEEEVAAKNRALQEAHDRVGQLERTVQDLQRLMELKGKAGGAKPPEQAAKATAKPAASAPVEEKPKAKPAVKPPVVVLPEQPGFFSSLLDNPPYLIGGAAALILAGLVWVFMIGSRRRKGLSDFEQSVMTGGDQFKTSIFKTGSGATTERSVATQSGVATDFSRLGLGSIDTHEVDPIAEAEVYMAYGRDAQAEEILKEALTKDPNRHEIVLKLLEIYSIRHDAASFETQASELYANLGDPASTVWRQAAELGRKLDPSNPLYRVFGEAPSLPDVPEVGAMADVSALDMDMDMAQPKPEPVPEIKPEPAVEPFAEADLADDALDFDLAASPELAPVETAAESAEMEVVDLAMGAFPEDLARGAEPAPVDLPAMRLDAVEEIKAFPTFGVAPAVDLESMEEIQMPLPDQTAVDFDQAFEMPEETGAIDLTPEWPADELAGLPDLADLELTGELPEESKPAPAPEAEPERDLPKLPDLDFSDLDLDLSEPEELTATAVKAETVIETPFAIDPDLLEEVNTKLDLARAYLEMGDKEGAREILDEVLKEGDAQQRQAAENLISGL